MRQKKKKGLWRSSGEGECAAIAVSEVWNLGIGVIDSDIMWNK